MKKLLLLLALVLFTAGIASAKELKVLTIGNSFANSVFVYLPELAATFPDCKLHLEAANIGGCSLERHWNEHLKSEKNPKHKPYDKKYTLREKLTMQKWDIVTIQQVSGQSWKFESFQPYAENIIKLVRELAPQAEIVIQQTWAYRGDAPQFRPGSSWGFGQKEMYEKLEQAYRKLAEQYKLRVIPTGLATQIHREKSPVKFKVYAPELLTQLKRPALPDQTGDIVGAMRWWPKDKTNPKGEWFIRVDFKHFNTQGQYMQACLWFAFLFDKKCSEIKYMPAKAKFTAADAELLKSCAQAALDSYTQVKR